MSAAGKAYRYSVELEVHSVDAPGTRLATRGDIYINICLLGLHQRTRIVPPHLPMRIEQKFHFEKLFKSCHDVRDIIERLKREHVLVELLQRTGSSPTLLASYETNAKDFLYPHSWERVEYTGLRRYILLSRTIDFPGVSPSFEFTVSPAVDDLTGARKSTKTTYQPKPVESYSRSPKRARSPVWKPSSAYPNRSSLRQSATVSDSLTAQTISSAVKGDYSHHDTHKKLQELAVRGRVHVVSPDRTAGRKPFVVRRIDETLIGRKPTSHKLLNDGLVVNDYSLSHAGSSGSLYSPDTGADRSRSPSPVIYRNPRVRGARTRSPSPVRRSLRSAQSPEYRATLYSPTPRRYRYDDDDDDDDRYHNRDDDIYTGRASRPVTSATLVREPFRSRHGQSPAGDLSDKVINTLRRNLESYSPQPWHDYYSAFRYSDGHSDDDDLLERSRRLTES